MRADNIRVHRSENDRRAACGPRRGGGRALRHEHSPRDHGFTLVEILIAIVLIGILSAVVVVGVSNLTNKGGSAACNASLDAARTGATVYLTANGAYPTTMAQMTSTANPALVLPSGVSLNAVMSVSHPAGTVAAGSGWWLVMLAGPTSNPPTFSCSDTVPGPSCPATDARWTGEYYANATLAGTPTVCHNDNSISFDWGTGPPIAGLPSDHFSVRWSAIVTVPAGTYSFQVGSDDGSRAFVDGVSIVDLWSDHLYSPQTVTVTFTAGPHEVIIEYYDDTGPAQIVTPVF